MIKRILSFTVTAVMATISLNHVAAETVELAKSGTLKSAVTTPGTVSELTVVGPMDASDFDFINRKMPNLVSINLTDASIEAYSGTTVLTGYSTSPANVLPAYALHGMKLTSVTLPESVTALGEGALAGVQATTLSLPYVTTVGDGAFSGAVKLESVTLSSSPLTLGKLAFAGCSSLKTISLTTDRLPDGVFKNCTSLTSANVGMGLESIGNEAFMGCISLESMAFGEALTSIGDAAFEGSGLKAADMSSSTSLSAVGAWAFAKCPELTEAVVPGSVTTVGAGAFFDDASLASIVLPADLKNIEDYVMTGNTSVTSYSFIPEKAASIGRYAYKGMTGVEHIALPGGVNYIGDNAMEGMTSLRDMDVRKLKEVPELGQDVWKDVNQQEVSLIVTDENIAGQLRQADQWKEFKLDIPSGEQDFVIGDKDSTADVKVGFEGRILVITAASGLKEAIVGDINGVVVPATSFAAGQATFDTSGMGQDLYTVRVTTADGRKGQFKLLRK